MIKEAIILAGGLGTRLRSVVEEQPKSMAPINGKPFLEYLLDYLIKQGVDRFIFSVGYQSTYISKHFGAQYRDCEIAYAYEEEPLGTGGAIRHAMKEARDAHLIVTNGDTLFLADVQAQFQFHLEKGADVSLALKPMRDFDRYGTVALSEALQIEGFQEKKALKKGLINGGIYLFNREVFRQLTLPEKFSIEKDFFEKYLDQLHLYGFESDGYFLDIGIPEDYAKAQHEFTQISY